MLLQRLWGDFVTGRGAWGLLLMRLIFGSALIVHGLQKVRAPASWMNGFQPGVPAPLQWLVCFGELAGGLALLVGFLTPLAATGVGVMMIGAASVVHGAHPYVAEATGGPSKEPALGYLGFAVLMLLTGPGHMSLDALWMRVSKRNTAQRPV